MKKVLIFVFCILVFMTSVKFLEGETVGKFFLLEAWKQYNKKEYSKALSLFKYASKYSDTRLNALFGIACSYIKLKKDKKAIPILEKLFRKNYNKNTVASMLFPLFLKYNYTNKIKRYFNFIFKKRCKPFYSYLLFKIAKNYSKKYAIKIYYSLLRCKIDDKLRIAIVYELKKLLLDKEFESFLDKELKTKGVSANYKKELYKIKLHILKTKLLTTKDVEKIARQILLINPDDESTLNTLGWWYIKNNRFKDSCDVFQRLYKINPEKYVFPYAYSLFKLNELDKAIDVSHRYTRDEKVKKLLIGIYLKKASLTYKENRLSETEFYLKNALSLDPKNKKARRFLSWVLFKQGKMKEALPLFIKEDDDPKIAGIVLGIYKKNDIKKAFSYAEKLAKSKRSKKIAADFFYSQGCPIKASQIYNDPLSCYYNYKLPSFSVKSYYRYKSGSPGTSKLKEFSLSYEFSYPYPWGNELDFILHTKWLSSGSSSIYHPTSLWVLYPEIRWKKGCYTKYFLSIGTTPFNGPISPTFTFLFQIKKADFSISFYQDSVKKSLLSYVGTRRSGRTWGRVLKTGLKVGKKFSFPSFWIYADSGYEYLWGKKVLNNHHIFGSVSIGKTYSWRKRLSNNKISYGLFMRVEHYNENLDYFTYGHGGYFSPQILVMVGPFFHFVSERCKDYLFEFKTGAGILYYKTDDSYYYPLTKSGGKYKGKSNLGLGYSFKVLYEKYIGSRTIIGFSGELGKSSKYTEYKVGLKFKFYF